MSVKKLVELLKQRREFLDFFYLTGICSGGKVRERPKGENCVGNFSESPSNCVAKQVLGTGVSV